MNFISKEQLKEVPESIRKAPNAEIWGSCWYRPNLGNKMTTIVFCGGRGSGKSYSLMKKGDELHRTIEDKPLFKIKRMCYTATQFKKELNKDYEAGTVVCLDDAGLALYNKEALTRIVREIGKSLQIIRRRNPIILMSLPFFRLLEGHAKLFADLYVEMVDRDEDRNQNLVKIQLLRKDYYSGEIYRNTLLKYKTVIHPEFGMSYKEPIAEFFRIGKPRRSLWEPYEKYKEKELDLWDAESLKRVEYEERRQIGMRKPRVSFNDVLIYVRENPERFKHIKTGKIAHSKILEVFNGEEKPTIGIEAARLVARNINEKH